MTVAFACRAVSGALMIGCMLSYDQLFIEGSEGVNSKLGGSFSIFHGVEQIINEKLLRRLAFF